MKQLIKSIILFGGLFWYFILYEGNSWIILIAILFASVLIPKLIPIKKKKVQQKKSRASLQKSTTNRSKKKMRTDEELLKININDMNGQEFERLCAMYFKDKGYNPKIVGGSGDHEVDLILTDPIEKYKIAVQCKCWNTKNVSSDVILRLSSGKRIHKCLDAWCITTSDYTRVAKEAAEGANIRIFNGLYVQETIGKWQKEQLKKLKLQ